MRHIWLLAAACAMCAAADGDFRARRDALVEAIPDGLIVVYGGTEAENGDLQGFYQDPNFFYLTGWRGSGAAAVLEDGSEVLFLPAASADRERWTGKALSPDAPGIAQATGFREVLPEKEFDARLRKALERHKKIYAAGPAAEHLKEIAPAGVEIASAEPAIAKLRMVKSAGEIAAVEHAAEATAAAHRAGWKRAAPGLYEYQVAATMAFTYLDRGCERSAYAPIVGSGPNSVILHYSKNSRRMEAGELLLMDVGAECAGYAADITRTVPVSGKFTPRQREIYEIVRGAQKAVIAAVKPGMLVSGRGELSLYRVAYDYINSHGKDLKGEPLGKYFTHGVSHHIGLEVHDAADNAVPLEPGMIISVEPGIYIPEENIGIRIEDMVLVTAGGARVITADLPREAAEMEKALRK